MIAAFSQNRGLLLGVHRIRHSREKRESMRHFGHAEEFPQKWWKLRAPFRTARMLRGSAWTPAFAGVTGWFAVDDKRPKEVMHEKRNAQNREYAAI